MPCLFPKYACHKTSEGICPSDVFSLKLCRPRGTLQKRPGFFVKNCDVFYLFPLFNRNKI